LFVSDEIPIMPVLYDGLDPPPKPKSIMTEVAQVLEDAVRQTNRAFKAAGKPGMPLSVLSNVAREAPLGSLLVAFLLGVAIGRRRTR
jgi:hypothetical protein